MAEHLTINCNSKEEKYATLLPQLKSLMEAEDDVIANMANVAACIMETFHFWWVGFYRVIDNTLVLGPFQGPLACTRIKRGKGVCGTAWDKAQTIVVEDVEQFPGHIACSSASRSEIVVPIFGRDNNVVAVLDIDSEYLNTFEVKYGQTASPEGMTGTLMESNVIANDPDRVYNMEINPDKEGNFYIGFHDNTEKAGSGRIVIDFVGIDKGAALDAPDSVSNFTVTPAGLGKLSADLAFTAPTKAINGTPLSRIGYFVIKRDGKSVMWIGNANTKFGEPGKEYTWTDKSIDKSGWHEYEVIAYSEDGYEPGRVARMRVFVGADVAKTPVVNLTDAVNDIKASWNKVGNVGANNGYVDPDHVSVSIYEILETPDGPILGDSMTTSQPGATDVLVGWHPDKSVADDGVSQGLFQVAALTRSDGGNGALEASRAIVVGKPINQPYKETFEGGSVQNNFAWTESNEQHASRRNSSPWMISGKASSNDDGGGVVWSPYTIPDPEFPEYYNVEAGDETSFNLPKVALNGVDQPVVRFDLYSENGEQSDLTVVVQTPDGVNHDVKTFKLSEKKTSGWETLTVDLTPYTNERYIIVKFRGTAHANYTYLMLDQIDIYDASDPEAGISSAELLKEGAQDVWTIDGRIARRNATSLEGLPKGVYMIGGRKVVVK